MADLSRRNLLRGGAMGLAAAGVSGWALRSDAGPTPSSGDLKEYQRYLDAEGLPRIAPAREFSPTERNTEGPFYSPGAPYRAKISPPMEPGTTLVVTGRVWSHQKREPLAGAVLDIWHCDHKGRYDNDNEPGDRGPDAFKCRARLVTDETGYYEYETIRPPQYPGRPPHIHYIVRAKGHRGLTTQMYFKGEPRNETDRIVRPSLITDVHEVDAPAGNGTFQHAVFDIVLASA